MLPQRTKRLTAPHASASMSRARARLAPAILPRASRRPASVPLTAEAGKGSSRARVPAMSASAGLSGSTPAKLPSAASISHGRKIVRAGRATAPTSFVRHAGPGRTTSGRISNGVNSATDRVPHAALRIGPRVARDCKVEIAIAEVRIRIVGLVVAQIVVQARGGKVRLFKSATSGPGKIVAGAIARKGPRPPVQLFAASMRLGAIDSSSARVLKGAPLTGGSAMAHLSEDLRGRNPDLRAGDHAERIGLKAVHRAGKPGRVTVRRAERGALVLVRAENRVATVRSGNRSSAEQAAGRPANSPNPQARRSRSRRNRLTAPLDPGEMSRPDERPLIH